MSAAEAGQAMTVVLVAAAGLYAATRASFWPTRKRRRYVIQTAAHWGSWMRSRPRVALVDRAQLLDLISHARYTVQQLTRERAAYTVLRVEANEGEADADCVERAYRQRRAFTNTAASDLLNAARAMEASIR